MKMNKKAIVQKNHIKYLGVIVDSHLSWKQIFKVSKKIGRGIGTYIMHKLREFMNTHKLREFMNTKMLKNIYYSLIYSHIVCTVFKYGFLHVIQS